MIYIYTLKHPDTKEVRYVGKSKRPKRRLKEHLYVKSLESKRTHLSYWILSLIKEGKQPVMEIIDQTEGDWGSLEKKWIKYYSNLCNLTEGGEGCHGIIQTPQTREKRRQAMLGKNKGKQMSDEAKLKIGAFQKGKKKSIPLKYTLEQIKEIKRKLITNSCKACVARELNVNVILVYEIANKTKYSDVKI